MKGSEQGRPVWAWQNPARPQDKVATTECPVSYVTGESLVLLEDFWTHEALGAPARIEDWPARHVDAFLVLKAEQRKAETERDA